MNKPKKCPKCHGTGWIRVPVKGGIMVKCPVDTGVGYIEGGKVKNPIKCPNPKCDGGWIPAPNMPAITGARIKCPVCDGVGFVEGR